MILGYTGTQSGMTYAQLDALRSFMIARSGELRHGDCVGGDEQAWAIGLDLGWRLVCHPPINPAKRAWTYNDLSYPEKDYIPRNHDIVDACDELVAAPKTDYEELRSGTWATIRYARSQRKPVYILKPNGVFFYQLA